uniref:NADH dehydrogenase subunit 4L n=1 Tax=Haematomyzus elephantis TaxID=160133 RepID=A0A0R5QQA3_9NEOP|nr:NADH dehydrogenase subunit 4L [Haematomyzus elephantis]
MASTLMVSLFTVLTLTKVLLARSPVSCLVGLEMMSVISFLLMNSSGIFFMSQATSLILIITFVVCEGVLGLSLISPFMKSTSSFMTLASVKLF